MPESRRIRCLACGYALCDYLLIGERLEVYWRCRRCRAWQRIVVDPRQILCHTPAPAPALQPA